jgi:hypothetical protein
MVELTSYTKLLRLQDYFIFCLRVRAQKVESPVQERAAIVSGSRRFEAGAGNLGFLVMEGRVDLAQRWGSSRVC